MTEEVPPSGSKSKPVPERFLVARNTLRFDRFMTHSIKIGGVGIVVAVFGIFIFICSQILPLFQGAQVEPLQELSIGETVPAIVGLDEWSELPFGYNGGREIYFTDAAGDRGTFSIPVNLDLAEDEEITALRYHPGTHRILFGTSAGRVGSFVVTYRPEFGGNGHRIILPGLEIEPVYAFGNDEAPVVDLDFGDSGTAKVFAAIQDAASGRKLRVITLKQKRGLLGAGKIELDAAFDLTPLLEGSAPEQLLVPSSGDSVLAASKSGAITYLFRDSSGFEARQVFTPFEDLDDPAAAHMDFVFGDVSIVFGSVSGEQRVFSLFRPEGESRRLFGWTKTFPRLPTTPSVYVASQRNKTFLTGAGNTVSLRYATTETVRWERELPFTVHGAAIDGKSERLALLDDSGTLHLYSLHDPHPEAGWNAFFGKVWYEGAPAPDYTWQSSGGTDDFEPKLSMVPLIFGSLKGTLYAMIFAVPIALLAAIYTSQFLPPSVKRVVKPTMEVMASLPSVVLGFLAALWLAPIIETRVPSLLLISLVLPFSAVVFGRAWSSLPVRYRNRLKPGLEYLVFMPFMLLLIWAMWELGPAFEQLCFNVTDPATGERVADFRLWWPEVTGTSFEQRNSLVVGFMMGFAVIPIVFTIAEDALSNVPPSLTAAAAALGASRWQVVRTVVIPVASAGIFSALMIGLGRAVGETMIMVMATGNTPILEWNLFSGMRTLAANIAVELPEAPVHSTHYRTLFLGAILLFLFTFIINTFAEILRQHLREKFKTI